jgi:hypothetical protein
MGMVLEIITTQPLYRRDGSGTSSGRPGPYDKRKVLCSLLFEHDRTISRNPNGGKECPSKVLEHWQIVPVAIALPGCVEYLTPLGPFRKELCGTARCWVLAERPQGHDGFESLPSLFCPGCETEIMPRF